MIGAQRWPWRLSKPLIRPCVFHRRPQVAAAPLRTPYISLCIWTGAPRWPWRLSKPLMKPCVFRRRPMCPWHPSKPLMKPCVFHKRPDVAVAPLKTLYNPSVSGGAPRAPRGASRIPLYSLCFWRGASGAPRCLSKPFIILVFLEGRLGRPVVPLKTLYNPCVSGGAPRAPRGASQNPL